jgi:hypothetical protein
VPSSDSLTPLPLDPELLGDLIEKLPGRVIEQLTHNWQKQTEALARSDHNLIQSLGAEAGRPHAFPCRGDIRSWFL